MPVRPVSSPISRRAARHDLDEMEKAGDVPEDDITRAEKDLDKITHEHVDEIDKALARKEHELLDVRQLHGAPPAAPGERLSEMTASAQKARWDCDQAEAAEQSEGKDEPRNRF